MPLTNGPLGLYSWVSFKDRCGKSEWGQVKGIGQKRGVADGDGERMEREGQWLMTGTPFPPPQQYRSTSIEDGILLAPHHYRKNLEPCTTYFRYSVNPPNDVAFLYIRAYTSHQKNIIDFQIFRKILLLASENSGTCISARDMYTLLFSIPV